MAIRSIYIGTSGWSYPNWKNIFYPKEVKASKWLSYYATHFNTIEINNSFYMPPKLETVRLWAAATPPNFIFSFKAWNLITHRKKLQNCEQNLLYFLGNLSSSGKKCGPILFQVTPNFYKNLDRLKNFIAMLPRGNRYVFEFRSPTWWDQDVLDMLAAHNIGFCIFELGALKSPRLITTDFIYIRLHGSPVPYRSKYERKTLAEWAHWISSKDKDVYVYFDNTDASDNALQNARQLARLVSES